MVAINLLVLSALINGRNADISIKNPIMIHIRIATGKANRMGSPQKTWAIKIAKAPIITISPCAKLSTPQAL